MEKTFTSRKLVKLTMANGRTLFVKPRSVASVHEAENGHTIVATDTGGVFHVVEHINHVIELFQPEKDED